MRQSDDFRFLSKMLVVAADSDAPQAVMMDISERMRQEIAMEIQDVEQQYILLQKQLVRALREEWSEAEIRRLILAVQSLHRFSEAA